MGKRESEVEDLVEKLEARELTSEEILGILEERRLRHKEN